MRIFIKSPSLLKQNSSSKAQWSPYHIPPLIQRALNKWLNPYTTDEITGLIKRILLDCINNETTDLAEAYNHLKNIKNFIHTVNFVHPEKFQRKYYLASFFKNELVQIKYSEEFGQLDAGLNELLKFFEPVNATTLAQSYWSAIYKKITLEINRFSDIFLLLNQISNIKTKSFLTFQLFTCFLKATHCQTNITNSTNSLNLAINENLYNSSYDNFSSYPLAQMANLNNLPEETLAYPIEHSDTQSIENCITRIEEAIATSSSLKALQEIQKSQTLHPDSILLLVYKGRVLLDSDKFDEALVVAEQIKAANPQHPEIYFIKGSYYLSKEDNYRLALAQYTKACKLAPTNTIYKHFFEIASYFNEPKNTLAYYLDDTNNNNFVIETTRFVPNEKLFCMAGKTTFMADSCHFKLGRKKLNVVNTTFAQAESSFKKNKLLDALKKYDLILNIIPHNDPYYNSQLQYLHWQKSTIYEKLKDYEKAKYNLELVMAICTRPDQLEDIYLSYLCILDKLSPKAKEISIHSSKLCLR